MHYEFFLLYYSIHRKKLLHFELYNFFYEIIKIYINCNNTNNINAIF